MVAVVQTGVVGGQTVTAGVMSCVGRGVTAAVTGRRSAWCRLVLLLMLHQEAVAMAVGLTALAQSRAAAVSSPSPTRGGNTTPAWRWRGTRPGAAPKWTMEDCSSLTCGDIAIRTVYSKHQLLM